jgi:hypothetical protein
MVNTTERPAANGNVCGSSGRRTRVGLAVLVVLAFVLGVGLRLWPLLTKSGYTHDGTISYLAATGNQGTWEALRDAHAEPFAAWTPVADWHDLLTVAEDATLRSIATDLAHHDVHPPLYFWSLHYAVRAVGVHPWVGGVLNLLLSIAAGAALYGLSRSLGLDRVPAVLVAGVWAVSPAVVYTSTEARMYILLQLAAVSCTWLLIRLADDDTSPGLGAYAGLALITAVGMLTHYYFALVALSGVLALIVVGWRDLRSRIFASWGAMAGGVALMVAVHPQFWRSFFHTNELYSSPALADIPARLWTSAWSIGQFVTLSRRVGAAGVVLVAVAAVVCLLVPQTRERMRASWGEMNRPLKLTLLTGVFLAVAVVVTLVRLGPPPANAARYPAPLWPFAAVAVVALLSRLRDPRLARLVWAVPMVLAVMSAFATARGHGPSLEPMLPPETFAGAERVAVDTGARGMIIRLIGLMDPQIKLFAAEQAWMTQHPDAWLSDLRQGDMVISAATVWNTPEGRAELLELLEERHSVEVVTGSPDEYVVIYCVQWPR